MQKPLAHPRELWCRQCCRGELPAEQCAVMGSASGWAVYQILPKSESRYRLSGKMSQRVKPRACGTEGSSSALGCLYFPLQTYRECAVSILLSSHFSTLQLRQVVPRTSFLPSSSTTVPGRASSSPWWSFLPWQCSWRERDFWMQILHRQISMQS